MLQEGRTGDREHNLEETIDYNLYILETAMKAELDMESIGGNAGHYKTGGKTYPCGGMMAYADASTGKFQAFYGTLPSPREQEKLKETVQFMIRVAVDLRGSFSRIVGWDKPENLSSDTQRIIDMSIERYNQKHGTI